MSHCHLCELAWPLQQPCERGIIFIVQRSNLLSSDRQKFLNTGFPTLKGHNHPFASSFYSRGWQTFSITGQMVNLLSVASHAIFVSALALEQKQTQTMGVGGKQTDWGLNKTLFIKTGKTDKGLWDIVSLVPCFSNGDPWAFVNS